MMGKKERKLRYLRKKIIEKRGLGKSKHFGIGGSDGDSGSEALKWACIILKWWKKKRWNGKKTKLDAVHSNVVASFTFSYVCSIQMAEYAFVITCFLLAFHVPSNVLPLSTVHASHSFFLLAMSISVLFAFFIRVFSNSGTILWYDLF